MPRSSNVMDLIDRTIGRLTVKALGRKIRGTWYYHCVCACGNQATVARGNLQGDRPGTQSCGCLAAEYFLERQQIRQDNYLAQAEARDGFYHHETRATPRGDRRAS